MANQRHAVTETKTTKVPVQKANGSAKKVIKAETQNTIPEDKQTHVSISGKSYELVSSRKVRARTDNPDWRYITERIDRNDPSMVEFVCYIVKGKFKWDEYGQIVGDVIATGYAEENRDSSRINKTSAVENAETSSIGRALESAGYGTGPSADEIKVAIDDPIQQLREVIKQYLKENKDALMGHLDIGGEGGRFQDFNHYLEYCELGDGKAYRSLTEVNQVGPLTNLLGKLFMAVQSRTEFLTQVKTTKK